MTLDQLDLTDLDFFVNGDVEGAFALLRKEDPVHWQEKRPGRGFWSITRYDDLQTIYRDPETFESGSGVTLHFAEGDDADGGLGHSMIMTDPPRHAKMRQVLSRRFTPRAVAPFTDRIRAITTSIIDSVNEEGKCDFVQDIAAQLPTAAICEMMEIDRKDWGLMFAITNEAIGRHDQEYARGRSGRETVMDAFRRASEFFTDLAAERRRNPGEDLVSALVNGTMSGEPLSRPEIISNSFILILGGQETTRNAMSGAMLAMIENPDQLAKYRANTAAPEAIEEFLRWTSPVTHIMRTATRDIEFQGRKIRAGDKVVLWNFSGNRDEAQFENPTRFDVTRTPNDHIAFGYGEHFCLGANLARLEMRIMLHEVVTRLADIELAGPIERLRSNTIGGIKRMPIRFRAAANAHSAAAV
ncbi:MAG TPA: cytochrome P450 [Candidatus Binataceae bacterium]|nr:cytochrome P450 [Candidatus Binataceae bacterium]